MTVGCGGINQPVGRTQLGSTISIQSGLPFRQGNPAHATIFLFKHALVQMRVWHAAARAETVRHALIWLRP